MKMFSGARIKLMETYTAILMIISIAFSVVIGVIATQEIRRPFDFFPAAVTQSIGSDTFHDVFEQRINDANFRITIVLIMVNVVILIVGSIGSYFLAQWTLRPIEKAMEHQARFVGDASHELRTPLAAIAMENEVMLREKKPTTKQLRDQVQSNLDEIGKLQRLTNYLLDLNQDDAVVLTNTDLGMIIDEALNLNNKQAISKQIIIENKVTAQSILTNAGALTEIISIIVNNAIKYSPKQSTVTISGDQRSLSVVDQGSGIAEADLPHIFDRFYRAEKSRTSEGYGLGLSLAQHLAKRIGATITAGNNSDHGAVFTIIFSAR